MGLSTIMANQVKNNQGYPFKKLLSGGKEYLFDKGTAQFVEIDSMISDIIELYFDCDEDEIVSNLEGKYPPENIKEAIGELNHLRSAGFFRECTVKTEKNRMLLHLVANMHWDREWFFPFQHFRMRLVELLNHLIDHLEKGTIPTLLLDGQTIVLDDYLEVVPEDQERIEHLVKSGKLQIGPFYVQQDVMLCCGESLIRNLLIGRKRALMYGKVTKVGYLPDGPGAPAQMPQILRGFSIDNAVTYRGVGDIKRQSKTETNWVAPDGSSCLLVYMPEGFNIASSLPNDLLPALNKVIETKERLRKRDTTGNLLLMSNSLEPVDHLGELVSQINGLMKDADLQFNSLLGYIEAVKEEQPQLENIHGELRSFLENCILPGVPSSRIWIKQRNDDIQKTLTRWAEPYSSINWALFSEYPQNYLSLAWEYLLQNQCQDNIGGCSVDEVYRQMVYRFDFASDIANLLKGRSLSRIGDVINTSSFEENEFGLAVFNPLNWGKSELVETSIDFPIHDESKLQQTLRTSKFLIKNMDGSIVPYQILSQTIKNKPLLKPLTKPLYSPVIEVKVAFLADNVPPCGYKLYQVEKTVGMPVKFQGNIAHGINCLENEYLIVKIEDNGSLTIKDKGSGEVIEGCHIFSDGGDCGDAYNYCPPTRDAIITSSSLKADVYLLYDGPVLSRYKIVLKLPVPSELTPDIAARSGEIKELLIQSEVQLAKNSKRVDILTEVDNVAKDHRLQVLFPASNAELSFAGSPFYVVKRPVHHHLIQGRQEEQRPEEPQLGFVYAGGLTLASNGLTEYAIENNNIALTLLRCVGWLNRNDIKTRLRQVAPVVPTPDAQCLGKHRFSYSIIPQKGDVRGKDINRAAQEHNVPLEVVQIGRQTGPLPPVFSFVSIEPDSLVLSALKKAEREDTLILRFYNVTDEKVFGKVKFFKPISAAALCNLSEDEIGNLEVIGKNELNLEVNPHQIITIKMQLD